MYTDLAFFISQPIRLHQCTTLIIIQVKRFLINVTIKRVSNKSEGINVPTENITGFVYVQVLFITVSKTTQGLTFFF